MATLEAIVAWMRWRYRAEDEDRSWDWSAIYAEAKEPNGNQECYAAWAEKELQGLMVMDLGERTAEGRGSVIIDYLAASPANRTPGAGLKHVGIALLSTAVARSLELGSDGNIRLESLPGAETFYQGLGMTGQGHYSEEGNAMYVFEPEAAKQLLEEVRKKGILEI